MKHRRTFGTQGAFVDGIIGIAFGADQLSILWKNGCQWRSGQVGIKLQKIAKRMNGDGCARHGNIERNRINRRRACVEATMSQYVALTSLFV